VSVTAFKSLLAEFLVTVLCVSARTRSSHTPLPSSRHFCPHCASTGRSSANEFRSPLGRNSSNPHPESKGSLK
jgi:hypothetical protein